MDALTVIRQVEQRLKPRFSELDEISYQNQQKVLQTFQNKRVRDYHFNSSSGYGYGDRGRDILEEIYAEVFKADDAMVRYQIVSGTHAISACLFAILRPGDELISVTGSPYDTLRNVIGKITPSRGTLIERGIHYREIPLDTYGRPDPGSISTAVTQRTQMVLIQRSRGYSWRPGLLVEQIRELVQIVRNSNPHTIIMVDNCYGEFTDLIEPTGIGADLMAGSLIKNPGGGLALAGGYIAGRHDLVEQVAYHITAPGLGKELGASLQSMRPLYQGLFMAPHVVLQALKGGCLLAGCFEEYGYEVSPGCNDARGDIVQAVRVNNAKEVLKFCQIVQSSSPVDSDVSLEYAHMPGYTDQIVMAAGTFVQGSSIEMSCDAPLRKPYSIYMQGGLTYEHYRYVVKQLVDNMLLNQ